MNINKEVTVTLTDEGMNVLNEKNEIAQKYNLEGNVLKVPLWELMFTFGNSLYVGCAQLFKNNEVII